MPKKIAVIVRDNQSEALRMAVGLILLDDSIDVYVLDKLVEQTETNKLYLETFQDMEMNVFSNIKENALMAFLSTEEIAEKILGYDHVLAY